MLVFKAFVAAWGHSQCVSDTVASSTSSASIMAILEGSLSKWTNVMKGWQFRWFVLDENAGLLSYYTVRVLLHRVSDDICVVE